MAHPAESRKSLRSSYVHDQLPLKVAAEKAGVSYNTASRWRQESAAAGDDWDKHRAAVLMTGGGVEAVARAAMTGFMIQYASVMDTLNDNTELPPKEKCDMLASLADSFNKTVSASKKVLPETSQLATAMDVVQRLATFIREHYPKHAIAFSEVLEPFGESIAKAYG